MPEWITKYWVEWVFGLIIAVITFVVKKLFTRIKQEQEQNQAMRDGMKSLLMRQIQQDCESAVAEGFCPVETKKVIDTMYNAYHALGGNGVITGLRNSVIDLPTQKT